MIRTVVAVLSLLSLGASANLAAQDDKAVVPEGRIIGKVWHTKVQFDKSFEYLGKVREELEIPQSPLLMVMQPAGIGSGPTRLGRRDEADDVEMKGTLFFLQTAPVVSLSEQIAFELVGTEDDFAAIVKQQQQQFGPAAELTGADDRYQMKLDFSKMMSLPPAAPEAAPGDEPADGAPRKTQSFAIVVSGDISAPGSDGPSEGPAADAMPHSMTTYYRFVDGIMYSSRTAALNHLDLPTRSSLKLSDDEAAHDLFADFDLREIPADLKRVFWSAVESQAAVFLQRYDNEATGDYSLRRAIAEGRLELLKSVLFDVDRAWFSLNLSQDDIQPITARLRVQARENSPLAAALDALGNARSQLGILQDEQSPLVVSGTLSVPETVQPFATAFVTSLSLKLKQLLSETPGAEVLVDDLMKPVVESAQSGVLDAAACLRGSVESGLVPCGGMKIANAEQFLSSLETVLQIADKDRQLSVTHGQIGDYRLVTIHASPAKVPGVEQSVPMQLNLSATGSWLWMTVGGERAVETLEELVQHQEQSAERSGESVPLLVRLRLNKWLGETEDPLSRLPATLLTELERWIGVQTTPKMQMSFSANGGEVQQVSPDNESNFTSYASKVFQPQNSDLEVKVRTASRELVVDATVGTALVKFAVAQFLDAQSRMFKGLNFNFTPPTGDAKPGESRSSSIQFRIGGPGKK